jgi:hypothetical protein
VVGDGVGVEKNIVALLGLVLGLHDGMGQNTQKEVLAVIVHLGQETSSGLVNEILNGQWVKVCR